MSGSMIVPPAVDQDRWHKLFKFAPLVMILLYMRTRPEQPITQIGLAEEFQIDRKTAAACLRELAGYGMVAHVDHNNGYVLCEGGQQMLLDLDAGWGKNGHLPLKESLKDLKDLKIKDKKERKKGMGIFHSSSTSWTSPEGLSTEKILSETGRLFGFETISHGVKDRSPSLAMSLIAHAYDQRLRLAKPQIFVYRRLQKNEPADKKYMIDPLQYLPNEFLHRLGLAELEIVDADAEDIQSSECETEAEYVLAQLSESDEKISSVSHSWQALGLNDRSLTIGVKNEKLRQLFEDRYARAINKLLAGILSDQVTVSFVVAAETGV